MFDRLPDGTWVYPGHGKDTTLGAEQPHLGEWRNAAGEHRLTAARDAPGVEGHPDPGDLAVPGHASSSPPGTGSATEVAMSYQVSTSGPAVEDLADLQGRS